MLLKHITRNVVFPLIKYQQYNFSKAMSTAMNKFSLPSKLKGSEHDIWMEYDEIATKYKPINLGGFPDYIPCKHVVETLAEVSLGDPGNHQYTRGFGHPRLVAVLSKLYSNLINRNINAQKEILVTYGASEALYCAILGHVDKDDEVILIEPFYNSYLPMILAAGGTPRYVTLKLESQKKGDTSANWILDPTELESVFNNKTKIIILNNPNNPLGKVYSDKELQLIADLCKKYNVLCLSDEVYEWMVYKPYKHTRIATLPDMWERTITVGSAGKTFGITGWKTGWAYGPTNLMFNLQMVHQNCLYTLSTILQEALARAFEREFDNLDKEDSVFKKIAKENEEKRDYMVKVLNDIGMQVAVPQGGFFVVANWTALEPKLNFNGENDEYKDMRFTKWMSKSLGLQGIPPSAFYSNKNRVLGENYIRFCFMKKDETLKEAAKILEKL